MRVCANPRDPGRKNWIPILNFSGGWGGLSTSFYPMKTLNRYTNIADFATKILGAHTLKFGGEFMSAQTPLTSQVNPSVNGSFEFSGASTGDPMADYMIGRAASYSELSKFIVNDYEFSQTELFAQARS